MSINFQQQADSHTKIIARIIKQRLLQNNSATIPINNLTLKQLQKFHRISTISLCPHSNLNAYPKILSQHSIYFNANMTKIIGI